MVKIWSAGAAAIVCVALLVIPVQAQAATLVLTDCRTDVAGQTFDVVQGDVLNVTFTNSCVWGYGTNEYVGLTTTSPGSASFNIEALDSASNAVAVISREPAGTGQVYLVITPRVSVTSTVTSTSNNFLWSQLGNSYQAFRVRVIVAQSDSQRGQASLGNAPVVQQVGMPVTGTCSDASTSTLNWSGVSSGGWNESWSQWMNDGKGGAVCSRTLVYSTNESKWIVG
jgi:hypothetical protein